MKRAFSVFFGFVLLISLAACLPGGQVPQGSGTGVSSAVEPADADAQGNLAVEPEPASARLNPLTGLPVPDDSSAGSVRPAAVVVDDLKMSRPTSGLPQADIVFETEVWEGIARFLALYGDCAAMPKAGPVREMFVPLMQCGLPAQPLFVSDNVSGKAAALAEQLAYTPFFFDAQYDKNATWIDSKRLEAGMPMERCRYTDGAALAQAAQTAGTDVNKDIAPFFNFSASGAEDVLPAAAVEAGALHIAFSELYETRFAYDPVSMRYCMAQNDVDGVFVPSVDGAGGERIAFDNVLVLFARVDKGEELANDIQRDVLQIRFDEGGSGYYCRGGAAVPLEWRESGADGRLVFRAGESELPLRPGTTYVAVVNAEKEPAFRMGNKTDIEG